MDWDEYFVSAAYLVASKSKDTSTQVGALLVGPDREIRASGYNGPPRGFDDDDPAIYERPLKYDLFCHAEENAITSCALIGVSSKGCILYATMHPCSRCARQIVQSGIREVVLHTEFPGGSKGVWDADAVLSKRILSKGNVSMRWWSGVPMIREIRAGGITHRFGA